VLGCAIDRLDMRQTVERCEALIEDGTPAQQVSVNAAKLVSLRDDPRLRRIVAEAALVNADGQSVVWAARLLGDPLPARVTGIDLMHALLDLASRKRYRVFVLGARRDVLERGVERLPSLYPALELAGYRDGYFTDEESAGVVDAIRSSRAQILFVAMSSPRKEYWIAEHLDALGVPLAMGVGGAVDVLAGIRRRAPASVQRLGLEWLFRWLQEPRRLGWRYLTTNSRFLLLLLRELVQRRR
jgi:N-acetylglucosaminyldiphosphoundecaprenol N-acetyl-beta-D-mannosaminyltransferase